MKAALVSILVEDQEKALAFYRDVLGFVVVQDMPLGPPGAPRWIELGSPEAPEAARLTLEPVGYEFARAYQQALRANDVPLTALETTDIAGDHARLSAAGVTFRAEPSAPAPGAPVMATFDDTCGNWIMLYQPVEAQP